MGLKFIFIYILLLISSSVIAQSFNFDEYVLSNWNIQEGLPQSSVNDIIQTQDGYIWLATFGGLVRFDGLNFTTFDRFNSEGMRSNRVLHLYESQDSSIWLSTEDGFIRYYEGVFTPYVLRQDESQVFSPLVVDEDSEGQVWVSTNSNIYKFENDEFKEVKVSLNEFNTELALQDTTGALLAFERQVYRTIGDSVYKIIDLRSEITNNVIGVIEYPKNSAQFFIATNGDGVIRYHDDIVSKYSLPEFSPFNEIWNFTIDKSNQLWILGYGGQGIWNGTNIESIGLHHEINKYEFNTILEDNEGNLWLGSASEGLHKLGPSRVRNIDRDEGLENLQMLSLLKMKNGNYLFSTNCGGVYEWNGESVRVPAITEYLTNKCNWSIYEDSKGRFWFGSRVLYRTNSIEKPGIEIDSTYGFDGIDIFAITEDSKSNIWIGALNGLYKYDGDSFQRFSTSDGLSYNDVRTIFEDKNGVIWVGTTAGLSKLENGNITKILLNQERNGAQEPYIRAIHMDDSGFIWLGTYGNGIFRIKDGVVSNITAEYGLFDNVVSHLIEDDNGYFWMGSNRGISSVKKEELNLFFDASIPYVTAFSYGLNDGMNTIETNGGFQPNVVHDSDKIFFPTVSGVAIISTNDVSQTDSKPPIYIEQVRNSREILSSKNSIILPHNDAFLEVRFTALNFSNPDQVQFRYMLQGLNENWIDIEDQRRLMFTKIPPGEYELKIIASNSNLVWSDEATLKIEVIPPLWQTDIFYAILILMFITTGPSVYYLRTRRLIVENKLKRKFSEQMLENQELERRRIASELHDGLGQQILVIKNRAELAKIGSFDQDQIIEQLDEIVSSAQTSINSVRNISHNLRPIHLEKFGLTEAIESLCMDTQNTVSIEWEYSIINIDGFIPVEKEINYYRIIQEAFNNILKHSKASKASIYISKNNRLLRTIIQDDGVGFDDSNINTISNLGFLGIRERVESLDASIEIISTIGKGTTLIIEIPLSE